MKRLFLKDCFGQQKISRRYDFTVTRTTTWSDGQVLTAAALNGEFNNLGNATAIVNADISGSAAIAGSKLANPLTGMTIQLPTINGSVQNVTGDVDGATITFSMATSNVHTVTLGGNRTLAVSNVTVGQWFYIRLAQDGVGSRTVTWFGTIKWPNATVPTLSTTASRVDSFAFFCVSSGQYDGYIVGTNLG